MVLCPEWIVNDNMSLRLRKQTGVHSYLIRDVVQYANRISSILHQMSVNIENDVMTV
jgi:hypothetical protein